MIPEKRQTKESTAMFQMKLKTLSTVALSIVAAATLAGCEGADSPTESSATLAAGGSDRNGSGDDAAQVYVVHGINGRDLGADEALPVDVQVDDACVLENFRFRDIAGPVELPAGAYDIKVRLADGSVSCDGPIAIDAPGVELGSGVNASIVAHLSANGSPTASILTNDLTPIPGRTRISPRHAAAFGPVDVVVDGQVAFAGVENGQAGTADLRPGEHTVAILAAGTDVKAFEITADFEPFTLYAAYAVGTPNLTDPEANTFEVLIQTIPFQRSAREGRGGRGVSSGPARR
jgi:hypothetical protein